MNKFTKLLMHRKTFSIVDILWIKVILLFVWKLNKIGETRNKNKKEIMTLRQFVAYILRLFQKTDFQITYRKLDKWFVGVFFSTFGMLISTLLWKAWFCLLNSTHSFQSLNIMLKIFFFVFFLFIHSVNSTEIIS